MKFTILFLLAMTACKPSETNLTTSVPDCIQEKIESDTTLESIYSYIYNNDTVFVIRHKRTPSEVVDGGCQFLCQPSGLAAPATVTCYDFFQNSTEIEKIY